MNITIKLKYFISLILLMAFATYATVGHAASWKTCSGNKQTWRSDWTNMYLSTTSFPAGGTWDQRIQYKMSEWNSVGGSNFKFYVGRDTDGSHSTSNGRNEVYFEYKPDEGYLGVTRSRYKCHWFFGTKYGIVETDIGMNTRYSWTSSPFTGANTGSPYNFELVMMHELGHALGLKHYDGVPATMNTFYYNGGPNGRYNLVEPHGDDRYGLRVLYPDNSSDRDISVSRFHNTGSSSGINRVTRLSGSATTYLQKGLDYKVKYTMENLGTITESPNLRMYLSTNSYISQFDTYLGGVTWSMPAGTYATAEKTIRVPSNLSSGTYYIGFKADSANTIPESNETNNFVALLSSVTVY